MNQTNQYKVQKKTSKVLFTVRVIKGCLKNNLAQRQGISGQIWPFSKKYLDFGRSSLILKGNFNEKQL